MRLVSSHHGKLQISSHQGLDAKKSRSFSTGLQPLDRLLPNEAFPYGAIHELLALPGQGLPLFFAALLARAASGFPTSSSPHPGKAIVWSDPHTHLYPPALAAIGIPLDRLFLLRPANPADELWALAECLRSTAITATLASPTNLSRIQARRLQLAAESGGGAGILLRTLDNASIHYAAASRWLVQHLPGQRNAQRWQLQLIHAHGGHVGQTIILEACHETHHVRAFKTVADRSIQTPAIQLRA